jgi:pilus assembly protein Flp/PilA
MKSNFLCTLRSLHNDESGQDLIEYALVAALIAFAAVATMKSLATSINSAFSVIGSNLLNALGS